MEPGLFSEIAVKMINIGRPICISVKMNFCTFYYTLAQSVITEYTVICLNGYL